MNTMKYAFAMLAPGGVKTGARTAGVMAAAGAAALAPTAHAATLYGSLTNFYGGEAPPYIETFEVSSTSGYVDQSDPGLFDFQITNDSQGNNTLAFGDGSDLGVFGTGVNSGSGASLSKYDYTFPGGPVYNDTPFILQPGTTTGFFGTTLTLSAVPEPDAWALLVAGAALVGGAARTSRRRRQSSTAAMA